MSLATGRRMNGRIAGVSGKQLTEQQRATEQLRELAKPYRLRVQSDVEGFPIIAGRYGQIEWFDGRDLAVYTNRPRLFAKLWAIPGVRRHQTGDAEMRALFVPEAVEEVARVIQARQKRTQTSPRSLGNLRSRVTSQPQERLLSDGRVIGRGRESDSPELDANRGRGLADRALPATGSGGPQ